MCVCVCVCVCVCGVKNVLYVCGFLCVLWVKWVCGYVCVYPWYVWMSIHVYVTMLVWGHIHIYVSVHLGICVCMCTGVRV